MLPILTPERADRGRCQERVLHTYRDALGAGAANTTVCLAEPRDRHVTVTNESFFTKFRKNYCLSSSYREHFFGIRLQSSTNRCRSLECFQPKSLSIDRTHEAISVQLPRFATKSCWVSIPFADASNTCKFDLLTLTLIIFQLSFRSQLQKTKGTIFHLPSKACFPNLRSYHS